MGQDTTLVSSAGHSFRMNESMSDSHAIPSGRWRVCHLSCEISLLRSECEEADKRSGLKMSPFEKSPRGKPHEWNGWYNRGQDTTSHSIMPVRKAWRGVD